VEGDEVADETGAWNSKWSTAAVTQFLPECRIATTPAAESASFMIFPVDIPAGFASWCHLLRITSRVADTGFASAVIASPSSREGILQDCTPVVELARLVDRASVFSLSTIQCPCTDFSAASPRPAGRTMERSNPHGEKRFRIGIRRKVIASFVIAYVVLTGSFIYMIVVSLHWVEEEMVVDAARHKATYLSSIVSGHLAEKDGVLLAEFLGKILKDGDIEYARVEGPGGEVFAEAGLSAKYAPRWVEPRGQSVLPRGARDRRQEGSFTRGHLFSVVPVMFQGNRWEGYYLA
jgi:hypothetical protein